jgi:hypothetical protein
MAVYDADWDSGVRLNGPRRKAHMTPCRHLLVARTRLGRHASLDFLLIFRR